MKLKIDEQEVKQAVMEFVERNYPSLTLDPSTLVPLYETTGSYEDQETTQVGYEVVVVPKGYFPPERD